MHRSATRLASFAWFARSRPQAICQPPDDGSLCEWQSNLVPVVRVLGNSDPEIGHTRIDRYGVANFDGGFIACGVFREGVDTTIDEAARLTDLARTWMCFAALPDGHTAVVLQYVRTSPIRRVYLSELQGIHLNVPNDCYNQRNRRLTTPAGLLKLTRPIDCDAVRPLEGRWVSIDDRIGLVGVYGAEHWTLRRRRDRAAGKYRSLYVEELAWGLRDEVHLAPRDAAVLDVGGIVLSGLPADVVAGTRAQAIDGLDANQRGICVRGIDGHDYRVVACFDENPRATITRATQQLASVSPWSS
jgi:hypothetical protein